MRILGDRYGGTGAISAPRTDTFGINVVGCEDCDVRNEHLICRVIQLLDDASGYLGAVRWT